MSNTSDSGIGNARRRPVIGVFAGFQMFGIGTIYGFLDSATRGIQAASRDFDCSLLLACGMNLLDPPTQRPAWPEVLPNSDFVPVGPWNTDGLIVIHPLLSPERSAFVNRLRASGFPIVHYGAADGGPAVDLDNDGGIHDAMKHLAHHGHRRVAFLRGFPDDDAGDSGERFRAYQTAARAYGMELDPRLVAYGYHDIATSQQAMQKIISSGAEFSAVLASNDDSAYGVIDSLTQAGRRVPQDVAVIGFDDFPESARKFPPLTSVYHPVFERGYEAVRLTLDYIEGRRKPGDDVIVKVATRLVVRRSCGCSMQESIAPTLATSAATGYTERTALQRQLTVMVAESILTETQNLNAPEVYQQSTRLIDSFANSLEHATPHEFLCTMQAMLARIEQTKSNTAPWALAIDALTKAAEIDALARLINKNQGTLALARELLARARVLVEDSARRLRLHGLYFDTEENGRVTAMLHAALDEKQILRILAEHLPAVGVRHAAAAFFEPEGDDVVAWSAMRTTDDPEGQVVRFHTREFPLADYTIPGQAFRLTLVPLLVQQSITGYMAFDSDHLELCATLTHAVNIALTSTRMYRDAVDGRRMAEEANRLKSRFLSTVSHELRTPLSLILSTSELLAMERSGVHDPALFHQHITRIRAGAQHLDGLIRDVLDLSIDEVGELRLSYEPLDLAATLEPVIIVGEQLAQAKQLTWRADIPPSLPKVWADRARLRQVVLNLVTNAVKFTAQGTITLKVHDGEREVTISVQDTGVGVPSGEQEIIFEDFHQSKRTANRGYGGLGLGLAICKRLMEMHAGTIGVTSPGQEGLGSTFFLTLPMLELSIETIEKSLSREQSVLLLDDMQGAGEKLHADLMQHGFEVMRIVIDTPATPLSIPSDYMPGMVLVEASFASAHGWDALKILKENPITQNTPVLFFSLAQGQRKGSILKLDYLTKPIGSAEMVQAFQRQGIENDEETKTILIVDDNASLLEMHVNIVQNCSPSYRTLKAQNGKDALALIHQRHVDLVLLDLMMPEMDGFQVLEALQKSEATRYTPVIVLTGQTLTRTEMARLNQGVAEVLQKGVFTVEETLGHIQQTLSHRKKVGSEAQRLARKAMAYIHEHFSEPLSRKEIARHARVSEDHLTRYFQHALGMPPMTYLMRYRISRAKTLLDAGDLSVTDVAAAVGFHNEFYFSRVFRRETGVAPSTYRRARHSQ